VKALHLRLSVAVPFAAVGATVLWTVTKDSCNPNINACWGTVANVQLWPF